MIRLTVDCIIEIGGKFVLIKRRNPPHGWALPGGFVDEGETVEQAVSREMKEETNLSLNGLQQFLLIGWEKMNLFLIILQLFQDRSRSCYLLL